MSDSLIDPITELSDPFNAKYSGSCRLQHCEKNRTIEQGDVCQYVGGDLMHMVCARRVVRQQAAPLCGTCWLYHAGECP